MWAGQETGCPVETRISVCLARHGARNGREETDVSFSSPFGDGRWVKFKEQHSEQQTGRRTHSEQGKGREAHNAGLCQTQPYLKHTKRPHPFQIFFNS